jgi:hypothetical protein
MKEAEGNWEVEIWGDGKDIFVSVDGLVVAKRGRPGTQHAKTWISLQPGYSVVTDADLETMEVRYQGESMH